MTGTRCAVLTKELQAVAAKHRVNIRAIGREDGRGFVQVVCVNDRGERAGPKQRIEPQRG